MKRLDGLYKEGQWWCNCSPRQKAKLRKVLKDTPNKGRHFWSCSLLSSDCGFFLWQDDASLRHPPTSPSVLTQRSLTSFGYRLIRKSSVDDDDDDDEDDDNHDDEEFVVVVDGNQKGQDEKQSPAKRHKINHQPVFDPLDDAEFSDFASDEERQLVDLADKSATRDHVLFPNVARTLFPVPNPESDSKPCKTVSFDLGLPTPTKSPSKTKRRHSVTPPPLLPCQPSPQSSSQPPSSPSEADYDVSQNIMSLLRRHHNLPPRLLVDVDQLLKTSTRLMKGIEKGRDSARAAVKTKDETIIALRDRVAVLDRNEQSLRHQLATIKAQLINIYQEN